MQVLERFRAQAEDGRIVEILKWGARRWFGAAGNLGEHIYSTIDGWPCHPTRDDSYTIAASGVSVRRMR